jgi:hypothetical protein
LDIELLAVPVFVLFIEFVFSAVLVEHADDVDDLELLDDALNVFETEDVLVLLVEPVNVEDCVLLLDCLADFVSKGVNVNLQE